jgi:hypothetical protein
MMRQRHWRTKQMHMALAIERAASGTDLKNRFSLTSMQS